MVYNILSFYKKKSSIFRYVKWKREWWKFILCAVVFMLIVNIAYLLNNKWYEWFIIIPISLAFHFLNSGIKKALKIEYKIEPKGYWWDKDEFDIKVKEEVMTYLDSMKIDTKQKIEYLIVLIEKYTEGLKAPFFVNQGIIVAILAPVWIQCISWVYNHEVKDVADAFTVLTLVIILLSCTVVMKYIILDEFINSDYRKIKKLGDIIKEIYLIHYIDK